MTFAQFVGVDSTGHLTGSGIIGVLNTVVVPVIFAFAFAAFIWGIVNYFFHEEKREEARNFALWGILGMVVLFSVWGFVNLMLSTLGISPGA